MNAETLRCTVCQREVRIVRLGHSTLALGHTQNPRNQRHRVQLARDGQDTRRARSAVAPAHREGSDSDGVTTTARGPSPDPALAPVRAARARASMPDHLPSSPASRARRSGRAAPRPSGSAPDSERSTL